MAQKKKLSVLGETERNKRYNLLRFKRFCEILDGKGRSFNEFNGHYSHYNMTYRLLLFERA